MANTEAGRISQLLQKSQRCAINENLAKARAYIGNQCCKTIKTQHQVDTPLESDYLDKKLSCYTYVKPPVPPQSVRISRLIHDTLAAENDPLNSDTRFSAYAPTPVIVPCPPIDPALFNGNLPKFALSCSSLPNTPLTPSLPV